MTWVWAALIVVGAVMIAVALWPSRGRRGPAQPGEGESSEQAGDH